MEEDGRFMWGINGLTIWTLLLASLSKNMIVTTLVLDRDKTLRGMKQRESGQAYLDGLVLNYNYFRPHQALDGKKPAESAGAVISFESWRAYAGRKSTCRGRRSPERDGGAAPTGELRREKDCMQFPPGNQSRRRDKNAQKCRRL